MKQKNLSLVILAGGKGSRLKDVIGNYQKCIVKVNNRPFLNYLLNKFSKYNFDKIYILAGKGSSKVFSLYHNKIFNFIKVICVKEKIAMGTGGSLYKLKNKLKNFILMNGDSILDLDIKKFIPKDQNVICKMSLVHNKNYISNNKLSNLNLINKKVVINKTKKKFMNGGIYFFNKKIFKFIKNKKLSLEEEILPNLIKKKKITGEVFNKNFFFDIGTKNNFFKSSSVLKENLTKPAFFLDRDGVINHDYGYVSKFSNFKFREGVIKGLKYLIKKNYYIFIVTNQAGIAKKKFTIDEFKLLHLQLKKFLSKKNIFFDSVKFCLHHEDALVSKYKKKCFFRKPHNGMINSIFKEWHINRKKSFFIGDKITDKLCAKKSKIKFFYAKNNFYYQVKRIHNMYNSK